MREYDNMNTYWHVDTLDKFHNIEVHGIVGDIKYLCCLGCQNEILGFQFISVKINCVCDGMIYRIKRRIILHVRESSLKFETQSLHA